MAKIKYRFDPHTLSYKKIDRTSRKYILQAIVFFAASFLMAFVLNWAFTTHFETPKENELKQENKDLLFKYDMLAHKIEGISNVLDQVEQRDDNLYRPIFELDAIPNQFREA